MTDGTHKKFLEHLDASAGAVWKTAMVAVSQGSPVIINPTTRAETRGDWKKHADDGDLFILKRVEVKHLSAEFTSRDDWPFGNKFIVCAKDSYDNALTKPTMYCYWSKDKTHYAVVSCRDYKQWTVDTRFDSRYEHDCEFYFCPTGLVTFHRGFDERQKMGK